MTPSYKCAQVLTQTDDLDSKIQLAAASIVAGLTSNIASDERRQVEEAGSSNATLLRAICGSIVEHSEYTYAESA